MDLAACTCANLRKASRVITQAYDAALLSSGLKATQFTLLATLAKGGDATITRLAEALVMDRTTLTRNLQPLLRKGLLRIAQEADQRVRLVSLTEAGRRVFDAAKPQWEDAQSRFVMEMGQERWSQFLDDLRAAVAAGRGE